MTIYSADSNNCEIRVLFQKGRALFGILWIPRTSLCAPKVIQEVNFPKYLWGFVHPVHCTYIAIFLCGVRWCHSRLPNSEPQVFVTFVACLKKDSVVNYGYLFPPYVKRMYFAKHKTFLTFIGTQDSLICGGNFPKRHKIDRRRVPNMVTIEIVITSTRVMGIRVTISCQ